MDKNSVKSFSVTSTALKLFFHLLYHQLAWTYDLVAATVSVGMWNDWVGVALPYVNGPNALELGHGTGHLQIMLARQGIWSAGLDASLHMSKIAAKRLQKVTSLKLINGYAQYLPFRDNSFSEIISTFPSEYIFDPSTTHEVHRVLAQDGKFIIIPFARITGGSYLHRSAACLFRLTGQAPAAGNDKILADQLGKRLISAGFKYYLESIELLHSSVLVIICIKQSISDGQISSVLV
jgi:ubiquinone/menaquinone biosynthesis C-methylase UbiE